MSQSFISHSNTTENDLPNSYREFATVAVHAGYVPDQVTGAVNPPIYASSTFAQSEVGELRSGFEYARTGNPTRKSLERALAELEHGTCCRAYSSGMGATDAILRSILVPGSHIVIPNDAYGGTFRLIDKHFTMWGIDYSVVDVTNTQAVLDAVTDKTALVWLEVPTNPLLNVPDIATIAQGLQKSSARLVVDNTFASPYNCSPLDLGADIVMHSTTKYLGGHSDVVGGAVITSDKKIDQGLGFIQNSAGAVPSPFDCFLTIRGLRTLHVRMDRHNSNASFLAHELEKNTNIERVLYPGLASHNSYDNAHKNLRGFGGMISLLLHGGREKALDFCRRTKIFTLAESLGGVESLIEYPALMTHASTAGSLLEVPSNLVRLSVGIENVQDLFADIVQALE